MPFVDDLVGKLGIPRARGADDRRVRQRELGTLPLGLARARDAKRVKRGDKVLLVGLGAGISVATMALTI